MSKGGRFARIARDLEKLPPELIEPVLADLEYGQIVRVSQFGGPRVTWAIENSPAWSRLFRGKLAVLQQLDDLTNEISTLCYSTGGFKNSLLYYQLSFLRHQKHNFRSKYPTDWAAHWASIVRGKLQSVAEDLSPNFAETAYFLSPAGHHRPLNPSETEEVEFFIHTGLTLRSLLANEWPKGPPTLPVMARWIALYKRVRHARIAAQAAELDRLVALHERHADRVKQPWAPQTRRPNPDHVVAGLRREAARLKRRNVDGRIWHGRELSGYRFRPAFAALVPYDWCLRLFCEVLKRHPVPEEEEGLAEEGRGDGESVYPQKVLEMMQEVLEGLPSFYYVYGEKMLDPSRPETLRTARTPWSVSEPADGKEGTFLTKKARGKNPFPHSDNEIRWLETFVEVILWMEEHFPSLVNEVRGEEWENCHEVEVAKIRREERKRRKQEIVQKARSGESNKGSTT